MNTTIVARSQEANRYVLFAKLDSAKILYNLTKAVNFKDVIQRLVIAYITSHNSDNIESLTINSNAKSTYILILFIVLVCVF